MENKISSKDRFICFGYDSFEKLCQKFDIRIIVVSSESPSLNEELVQDIISILHVFSCRLYGLGQYKKQMKEDREIAEELQSGNQPNSGTDTESQ